MWTIFKGLTTIQKVASIAIPLLLLALLIGGAHYIGYNKGKNISKVVIADYKRELAELKASKTQKQIEIQTQVVKEYVDRIKTVKETEYVNRDVIKYVPTRIDSSSGELEKICTYSKGWVNVHNAAAANTPATQAMASDATPTLKTDKEVLDTVVGNYSTCHAFKVENQAWRDWYKATKKNIESTGDKK